MGPGFPFPGGFDFSQLMRMLQSQGPVNFDVARQVAGVIATSDPDTGQPGTEPPIERDAVAAFESLARAAQTAVADTTGIGAALALPARTVDRHGWSSATIDGLAQVLEALAGALGRVPGEGSDAPGEPPSPGDPDAANADAASADAASADAANPDAANPDAMFGFLMQSLMPVLLGVWAGWMIGQLSHNALGQYDLPLPLDADPELLFVSRNLDDFASAWELPVDELRYALVLRETVHGAQRTIPWVRERLVTLAKAYVSAYEMNPDALEDQLGSIDFTNPEAMQSLGGFADAGALLGAMRSERQQQPLEELQRFVSVLEGYADVVVENIGERMVRAHGRIDEALRRHRLERGEAAAFVDRLLGLELDRRHYEEGAAFCRGVIERSGLDGLRRLWEGPHMVPTRPELEAPGLWLARIDLPVE
jgi:putative hydrolase